MKKNKMIILWNFMKGNRNLYLISIIAIGAATFIGFLWPLLLRITVDSIIGDKPLQGMGWLQPAVNELIEFLGGTDGLKGTLWKCSLLLMIFTIFQGLFLYFKGKWSAVASEGVALHIRDKLYDHLQYLPFKYHVRVKTGDLIQRCTSDLETIRRFLAIQMVEVGRALFMLGFALSFMLPMSVRMTVISMLLVPFLFTFALIFFRKVKVAFKRSDEAEARLSTVLQENLTGVRVVKAFARQAYEIDKFDSRNREYRDQTFYLIKLLAWYWSISDLVSLIQIALVLVLGTYWASLGKISLGTLLAFISYVGMLLWPVRQLGRVLTDMGKALVSVDRIQEILSEPVEDLGSPDPKLKINGGIEFRNVSFSYEHDKPVLSDLSFSIKHGMTVAILGKTGSGKSTLVHLLLRLYDIEHGQILLDGKDLKEYSKWDLRRNIGIALQEPFLFSRTIRENIAFAVPDRKIEEIYDASRSASVHDVINSFEKGYETAVGERGVTLSGGQKQRIAIARTLIRDCPVLIFDDSLSAVDTQTDAAIRSQLRERSRKATTFIISHRLTTLAEADLILVLENGKLVQQGNHSELILEDGLYKRVWAIQNELEDELSIEMEPVDPSINIDDNKAAKISNI